MVGLVIDGERNTYYVNSTCVYTRDARDLTSTAILYLFSLMTNPTNPTTPCRRLAESVVCGAFAVVGCAGEPDHASQDSYEGSDAAASAPRNGNRRSRAKTGVLDRAETVHLGRRSRTPMVLLDVATGEMP
jgi:hypothetical protein